MTNGHINPANVPDIALKDGHSIPQVGLGVLRIDDEGVVPVVESALEAGYRHIDGAAGYNNEAGMKLHTPSVRAMPSSRSLTNAFQVSVLRQSNGVGQWIMYMST